MHRAGLLVSLACVAGCSAGTPETRPAANPPGLRVGIRDSFYVVTGATAEELGHAMVADGPRIGDVPIFAYNEWEIRWRVQPSRQLSRAGSGPRNQCRIRNAEVEYTSRTLLPQWTAPADAPPELGRQWDQFLAALRSHEAGHHDLGVRAARNVLETIRTLGSHPCGRVMSVADTVARQVLSYYRQLNAEYDWVTQYGQTQGVHWPPQNPPATAR